MRRASDGTDAVEELFPRTKFSPPAIDERIVDRPALHERLAAAVEQHPLTVLPAPAGAGKTTAVAQWAAAPGAWRVLWVRLAAADDDGAQLAWALLGCLRSRSTDGGRRLEHTLTRASSTSAHPLAAALVNDLADLPGAALVLDDVHTITDADALGLLELLLDALHPGNRRRRRSRSPRPDRCSPAASAKCSSWSPTARPTATSPSGCSSASAR